MIPENHYATRKLVYEDRSFLFVGRDHFLVEDTGEVKEVTELPNYLLRTQTQYVIACDESSAVVKKLDDALSFHPSWTWRAVPLRRVKRAASKPPESKAAISVALNPLYCGFKRNNGHGRNQYFYFVDTVALTGHSASHHYSGGGEIESLITFATRFRDFCRDNGIPLVSSRGKIGGAFLRDPRFFGESERRIPGFINDTAREHLPGNHYELRTATNEHLNGSLYLDITGAHHDAARRTEFPDPNGLRARGKHRRASELGKEYTAEIGASIWARTGSRKAKAILNTHGLVLLRALYGGTPKGAILHPATRTATVNRPNYIYAYTNELDLLRKSGFYIEGIEAAWTSGRTSDSLNRYAEHAIETLEGTPTENKPWMKQMFLSTYGMLGKRPTKYQSVSNQGGQEYKWPTPEGWLEGGVKTTSKEHSPATTNVIALGMIQAETRRNVIELARYLDSMGVRVLALYADSLIVDTTGVSGSRGKGAVDQLPFLPPEWRVKTKLTNLVFLNQVSWVADEEEKLPGLSRGEALRESRRKALQARWKGATRERVPDEVWGHFERQEDRGRKPRISTNV